MSSVDGSDGQIKTLAFYSDPTLTRNLTYFIIWECQISFFADNLSRKHFNPTSCPRNFNCPGPF